MCGDRAILKVKRLKRGSVNLFAHWHPAAESSSQADDFSYEGFEGQVLFQDYASQDGFELWDARTCQQNKENAKR